MKNTIIITSALVMGCAMGCLVRHVDFYWTGTISFKFVDKHTKQGVDELQISISTYNNIIGKTNSNGSYTADISVFWGYKENRGVLGLKRPPLRGPVLYITKPDYCDVTMDLPLDNVGRGSEVDFVIEITKNTGELLKTVVREPNSLVDSHF